jgi:hypothetical protein
LPPCESLHTVFESTGFEHGGNDTRRCHHELTGLPPDQRLAQVIVQREAGERLVGRRSAK